MGIVRLLFGVFLFFSVGEAAAQGEAPRLVPQTSAQAQLSYAPIVKKTAPAVVNIYTRKVVRQRVFSPFADDPFFQHFFGGGLPQGMTRQRLENSLGSGVLVRGDGLIVTSFHVVEGADEIIVVLSDRREFEAEPLSLDKTSDLAVLRLRARGEKLPFIELADSDAVEVGDLVLAIGNPFGVGQTVTSGIVSALARTNVDINDINYYIQTDAAINPGNSGGALVDMGGRLLGINAAIYSKSGGNMGIGFAVPSNMVRAVIAAAETAKAGERGKIARPWMGLSGQSMTADVAESLGLTRPVGFLIKSLHPESPAAKAGLRVGDAIVAMNGKDVEDWAAFSYRLAMLPIGAEADIVFWREGKSQTVRLKLIAPPEAPLREETTIVGDSPLSGARLANVSPAVSMDYGLTDIDKGVVIVAITPASPAQEIGLRPGDVLLAVNGRAIVRTREVQSLLAPSARGWRLTLQREGRALTLVVR